MAFLDAAHKATIEKNYQPTLPNLSLEYLLNELGKLENAFRLLVFTGRNGAGACTLTGAKVGDKVVGAVSLTDNAAATSSFEGTITVVDQIQQSEAADRSADVFLVFLIAKS